MLIERFFIKDINNNWRHSSLDLAAAIVRIDMIASPIELGVWLVTLQQANEV